MAETDLSAWLTVDDTAAQIGCSKRTVERLGRAKTLEQRLRRQEGTPPVAVYNPDDVARIAAERRPDPAPFVLPAGTTTANGNGHRQTAELTKRSLLNHRGDDPIRQLAAAFERFLLSPPSPPVAETVAETLSPEERDAQWVTLDEAAVIKGRTRTYLLRQIHAGTLPAEKDRGWRIQRKALRAL